MKLKRYLALVVPAIVVMAMVLLLVLSSVAGAITVPPNPIPYATADKCSGCHGLIYDPVTYEWFGIPVPGGPPSP